LKKEIDQLDIEILKYLEDDARKSLKKLAETLKKKTSTIYHRLQRLKAKNFILGYSIIFNPEFLDVKLISMEQIKLKPLNISSLDTMFVKSFAGFINNEFPQVLFIGVSKDSKEIFLISAHKEDDDHKAFIDVLKNNPYIDAITSSYFSQIVKGQKLFNFNESWIKKKKKSKKLIESSEVGDEDIIEFEEEDDDEEKEDVDEDDEENDDKEILF
jgi:DNA-binding Lrp family transcriptional regulator